MKISDKLLNKIEEIRLEPEHIRLRWVWGSVIFSMLIIFSIWIFSITLMFRNNGQGGVLNTNNLISDIKEQSKEAAQKSASLKDFTGSNSLTVESEATSESLENDSIQIKTPARDSSLSDINSANIDNTNQSNSYNNLESNQ